MISYVAALLENDTIYGEVQLHGQDGAGRVRFNYSLDECIEQGYCPDDITTTKDFWGQLDTLAPSFLTDTISALNTTFQIITYNRGPYEVDRDGEIYVPYRFFIRKNKYTAMIVIYSIVSIGLFLVHHFKQRLSLEYEFKLSKLSKLMLKYLAFKTVFKLIYLALMFAYVGDQMTIEFNLGLVFLTCEEYIQGQVTFALAVLFAMGYGTRRFKIDASMAWKTVLLTACNVLLTLPGLFQAFRKEWKILVSVWFELPVTILYYGLISLCFFIGYNTYKVDRDQRYLDSAKAIIIGVLLNPFFVVPDNLWSTRYFLIDVVVRSEGSKSYGMTIPDLIELVVIIYLIYVWRDIREEELGSIQLGNMET
jgi:hypothetical protein